MERQEWQPSVAERKAFRGFIESRGKIEQYHLQKWAEHYQVHLQDIYEVYIDPEWGVSYNEFVMLAYKCTEKCIDKHKNKVRPLI